MSSLGESWNSTFLTLSLLPCRAEAAQSGFVFPHIPGRALSLSEGCFSFIIFGWLQQTQIHLFVILVPSCFAAFVISTRTQNPGDHEFGSYKNTQGRCKFGPVLVQQSCSEAPLFSSLRPSWHFSKLQVSQTQNSALCVGGLMDGIPYSREPRTRKKCSL